MTVQWEINEMRRNHLEQVLEIERASFLTPWTKSMFLDQFSSPFSFHFVATKPETKGDLVLCYIILRVLFEKVHILNLATHPACRRLGIAHSLLLFSLDFASKRRVILCLLEVRKENQAAFNLYQKVGFTTWRVWKNYYADTGEDALIMRLFCGDRTYDMKRKIDEQSRLP